MTEGNYRHLVHAEIATAQPNLVNKGFGRRIALDPRDKKYLLRSAEEPITIKRRYWNAGPILDQDNTSECVPHSGTSLGHAGPVKNMKLPWTPHELYKLCQQNDEWEGEDYEGTSVRACMKVFKDAGIISEYSWAFDVETVIKHVLAHGPVQMGTNWYTGMWAPDGNGFVHAVGNNEGGHAWLIIGANSLKKCVDGRLGAVRCQNSWGREWGQGGRFWLSYTDLAKLIADWGEAATSLELKWEEREPEGIGEHSDAPEPRQTRFDGAA